MTDPERPWEVAQTRPHSDEEVDRLERIPFVPRSRNDELADPFNVVLEPSLPPDVVKVTNGAGDEVAILNVGHPGPGDDPARRTPGGTPGTPRATETSASPGGAQPGGEGPGDILAESPEDVLRSILALGSREKLVELIEEAHAPRSHPDYPGIEVERSDPVAFLEGTTTMLNRVLALIRAWETRTGRPLDG